MKNIFLFLSVLSVLSLSCKKEKLDYTITYQTEGENYAVSYADSKNHFTVLLDQTGKKEFVVAGYNGFDTQVSVTSGDPTKVVAVKILFRGQILNSEIKTHVASAKAKIIE